MDQTKNVAGRTSREAKRARFDEQKAGGASPLILIAGLMVVLALIGGAIFVLTRPSASAAGSPATSLPKLDSYPGGSQGLLVKSATLGHDPYPLVEAQDGAIYLELGTFDNGKAHYYTYMHQGRPIEFFVLRSQDGVVRAAFNACDVCFEARKGYSQDGGYMVCSNCGRRFPADQINVVQGGCNPSPLTRAVSGDTLAIQVADLIQGLQYF